MNNNKIRREILQILYDFKKDSIYEVDSELLKEKISIDENLLNFNIEYLDGKNFIDTTFCLSGEFFTTITSHGIDIVENNKIDKIFPITLNQNIVNNSPGTLIDSNNVSINIRDSFNYIYQEINERNPENKDEIKEKIDELKQELEKDEINKSKAQKCSEWLKRNANWTIPTITQIILSTMGL